MTPTTENTAPRFDVLIIVLALSAFALGGLFGIIHMIENKVDAAAVAIVASLVGTAIGSLSSMLVSTSNKPQTPAGTPSAPIATTNVNPPSDPVLTQPTPAPNPTQSA